MDQKRTSARPGIRLALAIGWTLTIVAPVGQCAEVEGLRLSPDTRRLEIDGKVAKQDVFPQLKGVLEYVAACEGGKIYESLFVLQPTAAQIYAATQRLGLPRGKAAWDDEQGKHYLPEGHPVKVSVRWKAGGEEQLRRIEDFIIDEAGKETMPHGDWVYIGSELVEDPASGQRVPQVTVVKNIISMHHQDPGVLIQNPLPSATDQTKHHANKKLLPKEGTSITLIIEIPKRKVAEGTVRIHAFLSGRVQGVGFRNFTQRAARQLNIGGWVKNLADGRVELIAEGDQKAIEAFKKQIRRGPRPAKVENLEIKAEQPMGLSPDQFDILY